MKERTVTAPQNGGLLEILREALPREPRGRVKSWLEHGQVLLEGKSVTRFDAPVKAGQEIRVLAAAPKGAREALPVLYEDEALLAVSKPAGLLVVADDREKERTAIRLLREGGWPQLFVVHRLDRDTSGVLLFAKSRELRDRLQETWSGVGREYVALCEGHFQQKSGTVDTLLGEDRNHMVHSVPLGGKRAVTHYRVLRETGDRSLVSLRIDTGRKNQIRVHMKELGHPVVGDRKYGSGGGGRLMLHAGVLELTHPVTGARLRIVSPAPPALRG